MIRTRLGSSFGNILNSKVINNPYKYHYHTIIIAKQLLGEAILYRICGNKIIVYNLSIFCSCTDKLYQVH